jgi:hypothetical protein
MKGLKLAPTTRKLIGFFAWNKSSLAIMSGFILMLFLLGYVWWPLASDYLRFIDWGGEWWNDIDWLLIGIFLTMSLLIMGDPDLRKDSLMLTIGAVGGFIIESWGTQTEIWSYYTHECPPLWIIPAWPIATLSIDRLIRLMGWLIPERIQIKRWLYCLIFFGFFGMMLYFVRFTLQEPMTVFALGLCAGIILTCEDHKVAIITFLCGSALGYFLERWGTTRECWTYYTHQTPPLFAIMAHGMAAVAFWRSKEILVKVWKYLSGLVGREEEIEPAD